MANKTFDSKESGFSLVELVIVSVILAFVIGIITSIVTNVQRSYAQQRPRMEAVNDANATLDVMSRLIRMAGNNPQSITGLQAINPGTAQNGVYRTIRIRSDWRGTNINSAPDADTTDPFEDIRFFVQNNRLMKQESFDASPVDFLENVSNLEFAYFDTNNAAVADPVTNAATISRVQITLTVNPAGSTSPMTFTTSAFMRHR